MRARIAFLIIDPQIDFCDPATGALYVPGAEHDMRRLAALIRRLGQDISAIHVTLDSHHEIHIAHPIFWRDRDGAHPAPFTAITRAEVESGAWMATRADLQPHALRYVRELETNGRYQLTIWPPHCLIGSQGHAVFPDLFAALREWEQGFACVDYIHKGSNRLTEHYSAVQADVPDPADPDTQLNTRLIKALADADQIVIAGEARTHCVASTVRDIVDHLKPADVAKITLLRDAASDIPGFEIHARAFLADMTARGARLSTTTEFHA
ncbi:MAG: hypothetical protein ACKV2V_28885 [Blastocatellia bacterium]